MVVNFEFLGTEPIENVITCLHFKVDKVVFFGYYDVILEQREKTELFLKTHCNVQKVVFHPVSQDDMISVLTTMRKEVAFEQGQGNDLYFDITGGESLVLVAFGMLSREFKASMHLYDVEKDKLIEMDEFPVHQISESVETQEIPLTLDLLVEMYGGKINHFLKKEIKSGDNEEFEADVAKIWEVAKENIDHWNYFSDFLRSKMVPDEDLQVFRRKESLEKALAAAPGKMKTLRDLNAFVAPLAEKGILKDFKDTKDKYSFRFKNEAIKDCLWEGGSVLELHTYQQEKKTSDDCRVGVHLDWDGKIHYEPGVDVLNEIDVLALRGNVPTFMSCKSGKMDSKQVLHALYELDTIAKRFGGIYAKKVLITTRSFSDVYMERAAEMEIEVRIQ